MVVVFFMPSKKILYFYKNVMKHLLTAEKQESRRVFQDVQQFSSPTTHIFFRWNTEKCVVHSRSSYKKILHLEFQWRQPLRFLEPSQVEEFGFLSFCSDPFFLHFFIFLSYTTSLVFFLNPNYASRDQQHDAVIVSPKCCFSVFSFHSLR